MDLGERRDQLERELAVAQREHDAAVRMFQMYDSEGDNLDENVWPVEGSPEREAAAREAHAEAGRWLAEARRLKARIEDLRSQLENLSDRGVDAQLLQVYSWITEELLALLARDPQRLMDLGPERFEELVVERLSRMGYLVERSGSTYARDGGIDLVAVPEREALGPIVIAGQIKHHRKPDKTGVGDVDRLLAWKGAPFHLGLLITNTGFTSDARWKAGLEQNRYWMRLRDRRHLEKWLRGEFAPDSEVGELTDSILLAPGRSIRIPRVGHGSTLHLWPRRKKKED